MKYQPSDALGERTSALESRTYPVMRTVPTVILVVEERLISRNNPAHRFVDVGRSRNGDKWAVFKIQGASKDLVLLGKEASSAVNQLRSAKLQSVTSDLKDHNAMSYQSNSHRFRNKVKMQERSQYMEAFPFSLAPPHAPATDLHGRSSSRQSSTSGMKTTASGHPAL